MITKNGRRSFLLGSFGVLATAPLGISFVERAAADPAASPYPTRPVKWVVPYTAGGATDVISRLVCERLSQTLKQPFLVVNEPGAGANVGTETVINSAPDGYTLLLISTANAINASFDKTLPFDFAKGIVPVAGLARIPLVMVINNDIPAHTIPEFIAYAKAHSGKLSVASSGVGTSLHLSGELFKSMTGIDMTHVPYKGSAPALLDLMSGQIQAMFDNVTSSAPLIHEGKVRALGVTTRTRSASLPDVPPIADSLPGYETSSFYGLGAPRATPTSVVDILNKAVNDAIDVPEIAHQFADLGAIPIKGNATQFAAMLDSETERWRKIVEKSGAKKE
jgi:tripartite-type tricarboxylate transporter receptor subunit TctC